MEELPIIAFDESGNTGSGLLDKEQPIFVLSSVRLTLKQALVLKNIIKTPAAELKFNKLKKYHKYHAQIIELLNHDILSEETVRIAIFHKEYCISLHTVDRLIEPLAYKDGFDFYENGLNLAFTNYLFYCMPVICDKIIYEEYKIAFINLFQRRDLESKNIFYDTVLRLIKSSKDERFAESLYPILASQTIIDEILKNWDTYNFDVTLPGFVTLVDYWGRKSVDRFDVHVDNSKALQHFEHYVDVIKDIGITKQEIGTDRRTLQLPLKLNKLNFVDSKSNDVVQIADLISGSINHYGKSIVDAKFKDDLSEMIEK